MFFQEAVLHGVSFNCWTLLITWNHPVDPSACVAGALRLVCFGGTYRELVMFEIHPQPHLPCIHSYLNRGAFFFCCSWTCLLLFRHTYLQCIVYILIQTSDWSVPLLPWGPFRPCQHFYPERGNLPPSHLSQSFYVSPSSFHFTQRWKRKNPTLHSQEAWLFLLLFSLSDSFTHSVWHQPSPLLPLSLPLYTAFISMCVYTCSFHRLRGGSLWGENEGRCASAADFSHTGTAKRW